MVRRLEPLAMPVRSMASSSLSGCLPGRVASREIYQVNGIFFLDRLSRLKRDMAIKRWKKAQTA